MSEGQVKNEKKYPSNPEDIESEKEIVEAIQKLTPTALKLKAFAINHSLLKLKELEAVEQEEITIKDLEGTKAFQQHVATINDIVNATRQPNGDELKDLDQYFTTEELSKKDELFAQIKPISEYWLTAMKNHPILKEVVTENDAKAVKHLTKVEYKLSEDEKEPLNFTLNFHFSANEYFENDVLSLTVHVKEPREATKIVGTDIKWKEGKNLTRKTVTKKQRNKKTGQTRNVTKEEECDSFFKLFKNCEACDHDHDAHGDDEDEEGEHGHEIDEHTEWAYSIVEELIPYNLEYFLGVRKEYLGPEGDDEDFEDDDEDGDDDDDEDEAPKKGGKAGPKGGAKSGAKPAAGDEKKECKQQ